MRYFVALLSSLLLVPAGAAAPRVEPGEWEFQVTMDTPGMPKNLPAMRHTSCLTRDNPVPRHTGPGGADCKVTQQGASGDAWTWTVQCRDRGTVSETRGKGVYRGSTMEATQVTTVTNAGKPVQTMTHRMTGRRIGPCNAK